MLLGVSWQPVDLVYQLQAAGLLVCNSTSHAGIDRGPCRIIELLGVDRPGLLADITKTLSNSACDAWSASIWTNLNRATFVLGVNDARFPLHDPANWRALRSRLQQVMGGPAAHTIVQLSSVVRLPSLLAGPDAAAALHPS